MNKLRILVCGGRHFADYDLLEKTINDIVFESGCSDIEIVSGHCVGADRLGELYAEKYNVPVKIFPAEWKKYGKHAGPIRNKQMVDYISGFENKAVVAFVSANTKGTRNTIALAGKANIRVYQFEYEVKKMINANDFLFEKNGDEIYLSKYVGSEENVAVPEDYCGEKYVIKEKAFFGNDNVRKIVISGGVKEIECEAFACCKNLNEVVMNDGVGKIGDYAFRECEELRKVVLADTLTETGYEAFYGCDKMIDALVIDAFANDRHECFLPSRTNPRFMLLRVVEKYEGDLSEWKISEGTAIVGSCAFKDMFYMKRIGVPISVKSFGKGLFDFSPNVIRIDYAGTKEEWLSLPGTGQKDFSGTEIFCADGNIC